MKLSALIQGGLKPASTGATATATPATVATHQKLSPPTVATVATVAVATPENDEQVRRAWAKLETAIHAYCDALGESDVQRAGLLRGCRLEPPEDWPGYIDYFDDERAKWLEATRGCLPEPPGTVSDADVEREARYGRVTCRRCANLDAAGSCRVLSTSRTHYHPLEYEPVMLFRRCEHYRAGLHASR